MEKVCLLVALLAFSALSTDLFAVTADEVIEKNIEAKGGIDKLKSIKTMKTTGKYLMMGMELPFSTSQKRPNMYKNEISAQGMEVVQAFDGEVAWTINPFMGGKDPEKMSDLQAKMIEQQADIDGFLIGYQDKGYTVKYIGEEDMEGTMVHHLEVALDDSTTVDCFIDGEYFLELKSTMTSEVEGNTISVDVYYGDYKEVEGTMLAHTVETKVGGQTRAQEVIETVEFNLEMPDSIFAMPEVEKADTLQAEKEDTLKSENKKPDKEESEDD